MVAWAVRATVRMKKSAEQWGESRKIHERIMAKVEEMRRKAMTMKSITSG